ncbi:MAG: DNA-directed RNA polymerase subunit beta [Opitutales bacterium]|nr:DNA-directed RNA polymerase subunit beta [Opitutales bacterium]
MSERRNFGKLQEVIGLPNLIENQLNSYAEFLQKDVAPNKRALVGLHAVFSEIFPITSYDEKIKLEYVSYRFDGPKHSEDECIKEGLTYSVSLYLTLRLTEGDNTRDEELYMGELNMMTSRGSFIVNGAERVVVSQLHRSPGICYEEALHSSGKTLFSFRLIPDRGTWVEVQFDQNDLLYVYIDRRRRRRKFLITTLLRAMGKSSNGEIIELFYDVQDMTTRKAEKMENVSNYVLAEAVTDPDSQGKGKVLLKQYETLTKTAIMDFKKAGITEFKVIDTTVDDGVIVRAIKKDPAKNEEEALKTIYKQLRPGEPVNVANARALLRRTLQDPKRYDLGRVGRFKINQKLGLKTPLETRVITIEDIVEGTKYLSKLRKGEGYIDDIDHLGSRRIRTVGELLANQCRMGLARTEKQVREHMSASEQNTEALTPGKLMNSKSMTAMVREFFARNQLSQFMDQINPLSELTHKRRLSALGQGGLSRERAGFEVRDVHYSHYGRICPIETPEGPNIGLINSLASYAKINEFGFIETPYREIVKGKVTGKIVYLTADQEEGKIIAQANSEVKDGKLVGKCVVRKRDEIYEALPEDIDYMDVSPKQLVSVATGLIPFLEHDDANRALMGSNMQRQGVPLLTTESPFVGTGIEGAVARDSRTVVLSESAGKVASVDATRIIVTPDGQMPKKVDGAYKTDADKGVYVYNLRKFIRSNNATCFNQKPVVKKGALVKKGDLLADGASTQGGELALGKNVLVAFMPWNGYNFEDAILLSEKLIKNDVFTSIHIEVFEATARDTKLGPEEITRDIPNVGDEALKNLDRNGVIRVGAEVKAGDILVGKITPKSETELAPEEKLLRAIFGEKAADVKDTSLKVPSGTEGIIMDVKVSTRVDKETEKLSPSDTKRQIRKINEESKAQLDKLKDELTEALSNVLLGEKIPLDVRNSETKEVIIPANRKITKTLLRRLSAISKNIEIDPSPVRNKIMEIIDSYQPKFAEVENETARKKDILESGEGEAQSTIKNVKIYIAAKRKIQVGDKMAGRHGNKGIVARIVPEEDMPYMEDGTPVEICLNPMGVPSRMNVGQVLETHLGWACKKLGFKVATPIFDGISEHDIRDYLVKSDFPASGKCRLIDGLTGDYMDQDVVVGYIYMMKLNHLVADKIHARAVGPYSLITQQPLGGKAQYSGQRFGEMEVWALEAYGAAYTLQELLTVKSDDVQGRTKIYEQLVKGDNSLQAGVPQSFNVLMKEMQSLCLNVKVNSSDATEE